MENPNSKNNKLLNNFFGIYLVAVLMLWVKTYIIQRSQFELGAEGPLQQFLLLLNPLGSALLFLAIAFVCKGKKKYTALVSIHLLMSILLYVNVVYY